MRILFIAPANSIHSFRWINYFRNYDIHWVSLGKSDYNNINGINRYILNSRNSKFFILFEVFKIIFLIKKINPDIIHIHSAGLYGFIALFIFNKKIIITAWGSDILINGKKLFLSIILKLLLKKASLITTDAYHMIDEIVKLGIDKSKIIIIRFGIDTNRFKNNFYNNHSNFQFIDHKNKYVLSMRNFYPIYDLKTLILSANIIINKNKNKNVKFILVGSGPDEMLLKNLVFKLNIKDNFIFTGSVDNALLPELLCSSDVYVSTSLSDAGIASSTAEAMSCELPVIVSNSGENSLWINDGVEGFLFNCGDYQTLANKILTIIDDSELKKSIGINGRNKILLNNSYDEEMSKMDNIYKSLLN